MSWYAFDAIQEAAEKTKDLLLPFEKGTWIRLAILVIFTGGSGANFSNFPTGNMGGSEYGSDFDETGFSSTDLQSNPELQNILEDPFTQAPNAAFNQVGTVAAVGIGAFVVTLILLLLLVSSVFQFVYYQSLLDKNVRIRSNFKKHLGSGFRYMLLSIGFFMLMLLIIGAGILGFAANPIFGIIGTFTAILLLIPVAVLMGLINNFVLPETIVTGQGFFTSLKTGLGKVRAKWKQIGIYILARFGIKMFFGIGTAIFMVITLLVLLIPFGLLGLIAYFVTPVLVSIPLVLGAIVWIILLLGAQVVVQTYLNYYALAVYDDL